MQSRSLLPVIIGPTASGKTAVAVRVAHSLRAEIISADSRQVYRGMDIGTGKDLQEYRYEGHSIPYHLIDIVDAGYAYNIYEFMQDFYTAYDSIVSRNSLPLVCGGSGLYAESIIQQYNLHKVPEDAEYRNSCEQKSFEALQDELRSYKTVHNISDFDSKKRLIRALEIARHEHMHGIEKTTQKRDFTPLVFGISVDRETRRDRIKTRLYARIEQGLFEETSQLLEQGVSHQTLQYYGLEYKYASLYLLGNMSKAACAEQLCTAIFQFAKRQMTWFRGMERRGIEICWIDGAQEIQQQADYISTEIQKKSKSL